MTTTNTISSIEAVNESTVVALARECKAGSIIGHDLADSLGDDGMAELEGRLARRSLKVESTPRGIEVKCHGYLVVISAGHPGYGPKVGWDTVWPTREAAEKCADRAREQDGWSAKVVEA